MKVGFIGLGNVGGKLAGSLLRNNFDLTVRKLKENIQNLEGSLDKTLKLNGVKFNWKDKTKPTDQLGFIAQEVQELIPEVIGINNVETLSLDYPKLTAVLVKAIQELKSEIDILKAR